MTAIVLLPGMDGTGEMFADFVATIRNGVRPVIVNYPTNQADDYEALVEYAKQFLPKDESYILLGESFSGPIAIALAASNPSGLIGLVLCCTFAKNPIPWLSAGRTLIRFLPIHVGLVRFLTPLLFGRFSNAKLRTEVERAISSVAPSVLRVRVQAVIDVDVTEKLQNIVVPILYLEAAEDRIVPPKAAMEIQKAASQVVITQLAAPHLLLQTVPELASRVIKEFVSSAKTTFDTSLNPDGPSGRPLAQR